MGPLPYRHALQTWYIREDPEDHFGAAGDLTAASNLMSSTRSISAPLGPPS